MTHTKDDLITRERLEADGWACVYNDSEYRKPMFDSNNKFMYLHKAPWDYEINMAGISIELTTMTQLKEIEDFIKRLQTQQP